MAAPKSGSTPAGDQRAARSAPRPEVVSSAQPDTEQADKEMRRLLREAAWSRMFGKVGAKNPFVRRRG